MEDRSTTRARHLPLFWAVPFASFHVRCFLSNSAILVRPQVCWGLPLFRFPCRFHSSTSALLTTCLSGLLNLWPIHAAPSSLSYLLLYRSLPPLSPKLLVADFSRPPNPQDVPQALIDKHLRPAPPCRSPRNLAQSVSIHHSRVVPPPKSTATDPQICCDS